MSTATTPDKNSVMDRLKLETRPAHDRIESVPFSMMMQEGRLPRARFAAQLACWLTVHGTLEAAVRESTDEACQAVWIESMARTMHLRSDLCCHGDMDMPADAATATLKAVVWLSALSNSDPRALLGCLYVLEGSKLGGTILRKCLDDAYGCGPEALSYYWAGGTSPMPDFRAFKERMEAALTTDDERDRVVAAASGMFDLLTDVLEGLLCGLDTSDASSPAEPAPEGSCPFGHG